MKRTILSLIALTALAVSVPAFAGSASANLNISASVAAVCTITTSPVAFGAHDPVVANAATGLTADGSGNVACTKRTPATLDLGNGCNLSGGSRRMPSRSGRVHSALHTHAPR